MNTPNETTMPSPVVENAIGQVWKSENNQSGDEVFSRSEIRIEDAIEVVKREMVRAVNEVVKLGHDRGWICLSGLDGMEMRFSLQGDGAIEKSGSSIAECLSDFPSKPTRESFIEKRKAELRAELERLENQTSFERARQLESELNAQIEKLAEDRKKLVEAV